MFINNKRLLGLLSLGCLAVTMSAKVPVNINSGMPTTPFPQFKAYKTGLNLGMTQYEGITHAEMEKDIRGAYQLFANEWEYTGKECDGVKYIRGNIGCPYDCTEGDGYALLAAAYMGDKISFDGLWMRIHDTRRGNQTRYLDGEPVGESVYGDNILGDNTIYGSAADGDWDIALALYVAWKQWGDDSGHKAFNGDAISYKKELIDVVSGLAEIYDKRFKGEKPQRVTSGDIGLDGYPKNGNTWTEITNWANGGQIEKDGVTIIPESSGPGQGHTDYLAPAYYYEFYKLLDEIDTESDKEWLRSQFLRATASSDWIMGNWLEQNDKYLPYSENYKINGDTSVTFIAGNVGGRFRSVWRTSLNYVWHGNPEFSWNPKTHQIEDKTNTYEKTVCERAAAYCAAPNKWSGADCSDLYSPVSFDGPATLSWDEQPDGSKGEDGFYLNWVPGVSAASAVGAENLDLAAKLYRQCQIEWDQDKDSVPGYFDGWFRLLGMLTSTGNLPAPSDMKQDVNIRLYKSIEGGKTVCHPGETVTINLNYRNYGSAYSKEFEIVEKIPDGFEFVSADNGGIYDPAENTVTFALDLVGGRIYDHLDKTQGTVSITIRAKADANGVYNSISTLSYNGVETTADKFPNNTTATYEVNSITVVPKQNKLEITTETDKNKADVNDEVEYTISFKNVDQRSTLVGGRKDVSVSAALNKNGDMNILNLRLWHDAAEPLINYGNYRVSYFSSYPKMSQTQIYEGRENITDELIVSTDTISKGNGEDGQMYRMVVQFADALATTTAHLSNYFGINRRIHEGVTAPLRVLVAFYDPNFLLTGENDYSFNKDVSCQQDEAYYPIAPKYTVYGDTSSAEVSYRFAPSVCDEAEKVYSNIAVEEWDGYSWRLIQGTMPNVGYDINNVYVYDTIPAGLEFVEFTSDCPLEKLANLKVEKVKDGRYLISWSSSSMPANEEYKISYKVKVTEDAPRGELNNVAVIQSDLLSAASSAKITNDVAQNVVEYSSSVNSDIVSPNPTKEAWTVLIDCNYELYSILGTKLEQNNVKAGTKIGTNLPAGAYLLKTTTGESQMLIKK